MDFKNYKGKLVTVKFSDREESYSGIVVDSNQDWVLLKYNPVDFVIDGYAILKVSSVSEIERGDEELFREKVINLKGIKVDTSDEMPLTNLEVILEHVTRKFGVFMLENAQEEECYLGRLKEVDADIYVIDFLDPEGKWEGEIEFEFDEIRSVMFDSDYVNSLKLVSIH